MEEKLDFLIDYLIKDIGKDIFEKPITLDEKEKLWRGLCNIREPKPISDEYLKVQDDYLQERLKKYSITLAKALKTIDEQYPNSKLKNKEKQYSKVAWYNEAIIIEDGIENDIKQMDMYDSGEIYLQSLSSMIPPIIVNPKEGENILDMAAAPGGKTTEMASLSNNKALITACEKNKIRAERLKHNLTKQGAEHINVMIEDARRLSDMFSFDKILLDAPCSGSGTINADDKNLEKYYTEELVQRSIKTQKDLLLKASNIIKKGGEIIYSTCSILKEENEEVVKEIMKKGNLEILPIDLNKFNGVPLLPVEIEGTLCVCPDELYEGFFVAKLKKKG